MPGSSNRLCAQVAIRQGHLISVGGRCASSLAPPCAPLQHSVCVRGAGFSRGGFYAHTNPMMGRRHRGWDFDGGFLSSLHVRRFLRRALPRALPPTDQPFLKESQVGVLLFAFLIFAAVAFSVVWKARRGVTAGRGRTLESVRMTHDFACCAHGTPKTRKVASSLRVHDVTETR